MWTTLNNGRRVERRNTGQLGLRARDVVLASVLLVSVAAFLKCGDALAARAPARLHADVLAGFQAVLNANAGPSEAPAA